MENKFNLVDFENGLFIKNQLVALPYERLKELYTPIGDYIIFIDTVINVINTEPVYFYLAPGILDTVLSLIDLNRFNIDSSEIIQSINELIVEINKMKNIDEKYKKELLSNYKLYQEKMRKFVFKDNISLLYSLQSDAIAFENIMGNINSISDPTMFIASINYFTEYVPEIFKNGTIHSNSLIILKELSKDVGTFDLITKKYVKNATNGVRNIEVKEE